MSFLGTHPNPADPGDCGDELHGADGGACPGCGWDSHPASDVPAPPLPTPPWETAGHPLVLDLTTANHNA